MSNPGTFVLPMSPAQQRLWFLDQMDPGTTMFNIPAAFRLHGPLDADGVRRILAAIVERHEVLRTTLTSRDTEPVQVIHPAGELEVPLTDLSGLPPEMRQAALRRELRAAAARPFDLAAGPLFRPELWRLAADDHALMLAMHHSISDGWSLGVLCGEFAELWAAAAERREPRLPPLPIQYADYAHWHRSRMLSGELEPQRRYWLEQLRGHRGILRLPTDRPRPATQTFDAAACQFTVPDRTTDAVRAFCKANGVTLFMTCITAYALLLARYSGQRDVLVGIPAAGRTQGELEPLIGFFVNALVLRFRVDPSATLRDAVVDARRTVLDAFSNQDFSLDALMDAISFDRDPAYEPLVQATFALQNFAAGPRGLPGLDVEPLLVECMHTRYDLMLLLTETPDGLGGNMIYNSALFEPETVARMMAQLVRILDAMCATPDAPISSLALATQEELFEALALEPGVFEQVLPLVPMQRDIYVDALANTESAQNNVGLTFDVPFEIEPDVWRAAAQALADTQPVMRTRMRAATAPYLDTAYQCVRHADTADVEVIDMTGATSEAIQDRIRDIVRRPYDPHGVLVRHVLVKTAPGRWTAGFANHHMLLDGIASVQAAASVAAEYSRRTGGSVVPETLAPTRFHEAVGALREAADTRELLSWWREALAGVTPLSSPAGLRPEPGASAPVDSSPVVDRATLPPELWRDIRKAARQRRVTPQILMKCAFAIVADAHCRTEGDLLIQEFLAGRPSGHAAALGCYYQGLPFVVPRRCLGEGADVTSLVAHARDWQKTAGARAGISLLEQRRLAPPGPVSLLFNFITAKLTVPVGEHVAEISRLTPYADGSLQFEVSAVGDEVMLGLVYDPRIVAECRFLDRVLEVLRVIAGGAEQLADIPLLLPGEAPGTAAPRRVEFRSIPVLIADQAARTPDAAAIIQGDEVVRYADAVAEATRVAQMLAAQGIGPGDLVGVCLERSPRMIIAVLAVLQAGAAYVPMDAAYPEGRLRHMAADARCRVILTQACLADRFDDAGSRLVLLDRDVAVAGHERPLPARTPDSLFYVLYTSGSTGAPKGAGVTDGGEWNLVQWYAREFGIDARDRFLVISAFGFDLTQKNFFAALTTGAAIVLPPGTEFEPDRVLETAARHHATIVNCAPGAFYSLLDDPSRFGDLSSVRHVFLGGEPIRVGRMRQWLESPSCRAQVVNTYGPTECTDVVSFFRLEDPLAFADREVPLGAPVDNVTLHVVDECGRALPPYGLGELCIAGVCVGPGYWQNAELTARAFVPNAFGDGLMYRTGDLAYRLPDGTPVYLGRRDTQVKVRGLRIELGEIESALADASGLPEWNVIAVDDTLVACVRTDGEPPSAADLRRQLASRLPEYMIPPVVVAVDAWPLSPNGKVDRGALARLPRGAADVPLVPPEGETERAIARIWSEVLERPAIGREESFFAIGGHSLLAARVTARLRTEMGVDLPLRAMFEAPTVAAFAARLDEALLLEAVGDLGEAELERLLSDEGV
ncbi:MAG: amino acid adenylation domain-containing protein [Vicinamibacterales bacterium]